MKKTVTVLCPHCTDEIDVRVPSFDGITFGSCPTCKKVYMFVLGYIRALELSIMTGDNLKVRENHLKQVIQQLCRDRIDAMMSGGNSTASDPPEEAPVNAKAWPSLSGEISDEEVRYFVEYALKMIDEAAYFRAMIE